MQKASTGTRPPIFIPFDANPQQVPSAQDYFVIQIHGAQAAFRGSIWERVKSLIVASHVNLNHPSFPEGGVRAIQRSREVKRDRAEQLGLSTNLVNLVPAVMPHVSIAIDFILDKENRLNSLAGLINSDAFLAAVSMAPVSATVARTVSGIAEKIINTFIPAQEREPILQFAGDLNLAGDRVLEGYYVIVGTRDDEMGLPDATARSQVINGTLQINGQAADWLSYVIFGVHRTAARGRDLNGGAVWEQRLREAEDEARNTLQDPLADRDRRQDIWKKCVTLIREAQVLLRSDPNYHRDEADKIVRTALLDCQKLVVVPPVIARGMGRGTSPSSVTSQLPKDLESHLAMLDVRPDEDLKKSAADYAEQLRLSQDALTRSVSENSSLVLLNSLEKEREGVRIIRNHGENIPILPSRTRFAFTSKPARMVAG
jgi:hypothetical protein